MDRAEEIKNSVLEDMYGDVLLAIEALDDEDYLNIAGYTIDDQADIDDAIELLRKMKMKVPNDFTKYAIELSPTEAHEADFWDGHDYYRYSDCWDYWVGNDW